MSIISAKMIYPRIERRCDEDIYCRKPIAIGTPCLRLYGSADSGDPKYTLYLHPKCSHSNDPKINAALQQPQPARDQGGEATG